MLNSIQPKDSPIWRFLNEHHPALPTEKKQNLFRLLQESGIPATDKIFPWVVETALTRIEIAGLSAQLMQVESNLANHPQELKNSLELILSPYLQEVGRNRMANDNLTKELRAAAILDANITESGWRGIGTALSAIFKHQNLSMVVGIIMVFGGVLGFGIAWKLGAPNRLMLEQNQQVLEFCQQTWIPKTRHSGWYTCPTWQLPVPSNK